MFNLKNYFMLLQKNYIKVLSLFIISLFANFTLQAQAPTEYYKDAKEKNGYDLKTALHNIIKGHNSQSYSSLWQHFKTTDKDKYYEKDGSVLDMYSENPTGADPYNFQWSSDQCGQYKNEGSCYNREHSFPKSWFGKKAPMNTDLFHLYPTDGKVNGQRGNHPFGEVGTATWTSKNGSKLGNSSVNGFSGTVFEPIDEFKGDFARTYFYMATRYENIVSNWNSPMLNNTADQVFKEWAVKMLLKWHTQDPVSQKEIDRNNAVFGIQGNRNPFIDHPEYVNLIWGDANVMIIKNIKLTPAQPKANESVSISAKIIHTDGVKSAKLFWGTNKDAMTNEIAMHITTDNNYTTEKNIAGQTDMTTVFYKIETIDNKDITTYSSIYNYSIGSEQPITNKSFFNEDFESTTNNQDISLQGWINKTEKGKRKWQGKEYNGNKYAQFSSYKSNEENEAWLITPKIDLGKISEPKFTFDIKVGHFTHKGLQIFLLKDFDGTNIASATKTDISSDFSIPTKPTSGYGTFANAGKFDLSSYSGEIHFAFKYSGNGKNKKTTTYQIDNVKIEGKAKKNGIHSDKETSFSVIPNPNNGNFKIILDPKENPIKASIFSIDAQLILTKNIIKGSENITINIDKKAGVYILKIYFKEKIKTSKIIIE